MSNVRKSSLDNRWGLSALEVDALVALCMHHWHPEDRARIAAALPRVYAKLTDTTVTVTTSGDPDTEVIVIGRNL